MTKRVRVRFAPSPTGGLHLGGVRTVLFNYLFAKAHKGDFILRIEDTDRTRFVEGAEQYILDCLHWCGLEPDESPVHGGPHAPYRQSERKDLYMQYALQLIESGHAYYAFDTPEELEAMRNMPKSNEHDIIQYDARMRTKMRNSLTLTPEATQELLDKGTPYVVRIKMPQNESVSFTDMIRGHITFDTNLVDDKVLLKADGMPTYHLAVVVDDYLMKISHAFRGEEWLPSAPVHILLWVHLGWGDHMPHWAHLPLILKPDGHGKLSKRDGDRLGFPVFPLAWHDAAKNEDNKGFREIGFLPEAFVNMLAMLGWNDGSGKELFSLAELIEQFDIERVHKGGAKFDFEKAKWINNQYIQQANTSDLASMLTPIFRDKGIDTDQDTLLKVVPLIKDRCTLLPDFYDQGAYFFATPSIKELPAIKDKWNADKEAFFTQWAQNIAAITLWTEADIEADFMQALGHTTLKKGDVLLPLRIMLVGGKFGPSVFAIAALIGPAETAKRIQLAIEACK